MSTVHIIVNIAFFFVACSFFMKDMLWLRLLAIIGSCFSITYNMNVAEHYLWVPIGWNCFFILINLYHSFKIILGNKLIKLSEKEKDLYNLAFTNLSLKDFSLLLKIAEWKTIEKDTVFIEENQKMNKFLIVYSGCMLLNIGNRKITEIKDGQFIGEMSFFSETNSGSNVVANKQSEVVVWNIEDIRKLAKTNPTLIYSLQASMVIQMGNSLRLRNYREFAVANT